MPPAGFNTPLDLGCPDLAEPLWDSVGFSQERVGETDVRIINEIMSLSTAHCDYQIIIQLTVLEATNDYQRENNLVAELEQKLVLLHEVFDGTISNGGYVFITAFPTKASSDQSSLERYGMVLGKWSFRLNVSHTNPEARSL